jgi:hypothetical protein
MRLRSRRASMEYKLLNIFNNFLCAGAVVIYNILIVGVLKKHYKDKRHREKEVQLISNEFP